MRSAKSRVGRLVSAQLGRQPWAGIFKWFDGVMVDNVPLTLKAACPFDRAEKL